MKFWFTFLTRRIVGASPARRFKASLPVAFRARALALLCATSVAAHAQQTVVGNYNSGSLTVVDLSSGNRVVLAKGAAWPGSAIAPANSTARESNGNILVGEGGNPARIVRIDRTTGVRTVLSCSKKGSEVGKGPELANVYGLAIVDDKTIFASIFFGNAIYRIDLATGDREVVTSGDLATNIGPHGLLVDTDGTLVFVTGHGGSKVFRFNASTGARTVISSFGSSMEPTVGTGPNLHYPVSILKLSDGTFAVLNREGDDYILKVDPSTGDRTLISGTNRGTGPALNHLRNAMAMDTSGNLYVANFYANSITKIDPATGNRTIVSSESVGAGPGLSGPTALLAGTVARIFDAPAVSAVSPSSGSSVGSTTVKIMGMNFTGATAVKFGASAATGFTVDSDSQITATAPAGVVGSTVDVQITTANGTSATNTEDQFTYVSIAPIVGDLGGAPAAFTEDGSAVLLDTGSNATVTDTDSANFSGGNVTVSIATNRVSGEDVLSIRNQGTGAGQIGVSEGNVTYAGTTIGTFAGGSGTSDLVVTLNANATPTNIGALLQNLTYHNTNSGTPSTSARTVRVTVNDGAGGISTAADVTVTVTAVNDAPSSSGLPTDVTVVEDTASAFDLSAVTLVDPDVGTDLMTLTLTASAGTLSATSGGGVTISGAGTTALTLTGPLVNLNTFLDSAADIAYTGAANAYGDNAATVTMKLNDGALESTLGTVNVDITAVNDAPTLDAISDPAAILEDAGQQTVALSGISAGPGETQTLTVTATSNNPGLIPNPAVTYTSPNATGSLSYTPVANASGSAVITVTVTDDGSGSATFSRTFTVNVTAANDAPTLSTISTLTGASEDMPFTIAFATLAAAANEADIDGDTLSFRVEAVSSGTLTKGGLPVVAGTTLLGTGESLAWSPAADANGTLDAFTVTAWDGTVASATAAQVRVSVTAIADLPTVTSATTAEDTQTTSGLILTKNAADGAEVTHFRITAISGGTLFQNDGTTAIANGDAITVAAGDAGLKFTPAPNKNTAAGDTFSFAVQAANDGAGSGQSAAATATITVTSVNDTPTTIALSTNSIRRSAAANATIGTLSTTDVDTDDMFTYTLVSGAGDTDNGSFNLSGATLRATNPYALTGGTRSVRVRSTDAGGLWCEQAFSITVVDDLLVVTSNTDAALRQAILDLPAGGVISFALTSGSETITIDESLVIDKSLTIDGRNTAGSGKPVTVQVRTPGVSTWRVMVISLDTDNAVTLQNLVLRGGDVSGKKTPLGGAVMSQGGALDLIEVTVRDGVAQAGGGLGTASTTRAIRCTFTGNAAVGTSEEGAAGGGIYSLGSPLLLMNCTIVGNTCQSDVSLSFGGGACFEGPGSIINSTITGNTVSGTAPSREGGGVYNHVGPVSILNSLVVGNQAASGADIATTAGATTSCYYSWFAGVSGTIDTQAAAPNQIAACSADQLSALGNYGGTTQTVRVNAGAPAIGHGTFVYENGGYWFLATDGAYHRLDAYATTVTVEPTGKIVTDQRGIARTSPPTIGAYQVGLKVAGTITRAGGAAFSGVTVSDGTRSATTDASGNFELRDVPPGTYTLTPSSPGYMFTPASRSVVVSASDISGADFVAAPVPVEKASQTITFAPLADATLGQTVSLSASASSGLAVSFSIVSGPATLSGSTVTCTGIGTVTVRATQPGNTSYNAATPVVQSLTVGLPTPTVTTPTQVPAPLPGGAATLAVPTPLASATYRWQRNGADLTGATGPTLTLPAVQPPSAGLYTYTVQTPGGASATSDPVIVGVATTEKVVGTGEQVGADIVHPNGNIYDQLLLEGAGATFTAEPAQVTRMSYVDLSGDIVQVEFSGAGSLSLVMDDASTPAPAANYNQPGVNYVRGHVGIVITGADETTNVSVFSVGRITAVNQTLFREEVAYDGVANIAFIAIRSTNGQFGGVRTGNVEYYASSGFTGLYAPGVAFSGPVNIGDIQAFDNAQPLLVVGSASNVRIAGGSLAQPNGQSVTVNGLTRLTMAPGQTSQGGALPAQTNQGVLHQDGVDVTDLLVAGQ